MSLLNDPTLKYTYTPDMIYGPEWWTKLGDDVNIDLLVFRPPQAGETVVAETSTTYDGKLHLTEFSRAGFVLPRLVLVKPQSFKLVPVLSKVEFNNYLGKKTLYYMEYGKVKYPETPQFTLGRTYVLLEDKE